MFIIRPIMNLISGGAGGFATGTEYAPGGMAWVGEHGKELVSLPRGSKVFTAAESRRMSAANDGRMGSVTIPISIDATGADAAGLARVQGELQQLRTDLPVLVAEHWSDANGRFLFRGQRR
jgi:phage-related tail protein